MKKSKLQSLCKEANAIVQEVSLFIKGESQQFVTDDIEEKGMNSLVSYVDKEAERQLVNKLAAILPGAGFITEEDTVKDHKKEYTWIIDPLDGTTNFLNRIPHYSVSVALSNGDQVLLGIVNEVIGNEMFYAWRGGGAFLNGQSIKVSRVNQLEKAIVATGFPYDFERDKGELLNVLGHWLQHTRGMRRLGSAALDLAYVAAGRFETFYETTLNVWDVAAGALIVKEAGGIVTDFSGGDNYLYGAEIIASNKNLAHHFIDYFKKLKQENG